MKENPVELNQKYKNIHNVHLYVCCLKLKVSELKIDRRKLLFFPCSSNKYLVYVILILKLIKHIEKYYKYYEIGHQNRNTKTYLYTFLFD